LLKGATGPHLSDHIFAKVIERRTGYVPSLSWPENGRYGCAPRRPSRRGTSWSPKIGMPILIGVVAIEKIDSEGKFHLARLFVRPFALRAGIGRTLFEAAVKLVEIEEELGCRSSPTRSPRRSPHGLAQREPARHPPMPNLAACYPSWKIGLHYQNGGCSRTRTCDPLIKSQRPYPRPLQPQCADRSRRPPHGEAKPQDGHISPLLPAANVREARQSPAS
jgi:GNAT superfamily N-acetyltransferase